MPGDSTTPSTPGTRVAVRFLLAEPDPVTGARLTDVTGTLVENGPDRVVVEAPDTERTPDAGTSTASRQTLITGEAVRRAAVALREALEAAGALGPSGGMEDPAAALGSVEGRVFSGEFSPVTDPIGSDKANPVSHVTYGYGAQLVHLAEDGRVRKVVAAYDAGTVVNQQALQGQVEGGIVMGLGYALTEEPAGGSTGPTETPRLVGAWRNAVS